MLEVAFRSAREQSKQKKLRGNWLQIIRQKEKMKLDIVKDRLISQLLSIAKSFPTLDDLPPFYQSLVRLTIDADEFKKSCATLRWAVNRVVYFQAQYARMIAKTTQRPMIAQLSSQAYGRIASVIKQMDHSLRFLNESRAILRTFPDIKPMFTVCIYGFPNVGKTTLLNTLADTRAKVAAYAFTTTSINSGFITLDGEKIQLLDVPGTLAREKHNLVELQAELVLKEVANLVIFVFDVSESSGYSREKQEKLYKSVSKLKPTIVYVSKMDIADKELLAKVKWKALSMEELNAEILKRYRKGQISTSSK